MSGGKQQDLQTYLHEQIPLSAAMQVSVVSASPDAVTLSAPLVPNINHKSTAFGGSVSALAVLAAWSLVHLRLQEAGYPCEIVIQSSQVDYDRPISGRFEATSALKDQADWAPFMKMLARRGRARIRVGSVVSCDGVAAARFEGSFVALLRERRS